MRSHVGSEKEKKKKKREREKGRGGRSGTQRGVYLLSNQSERERERGRDEKKFRGTSGNLRVG